MEANADTIARQRDMIDYQAQTIEELKTSLTALAETQAQELKSLPTMFEALETSLSKHTKEQKAWRQHRKEHTEGQTVLAEQLVIPSKRTTTAYESLERVSEYISAIRRSKDRFDRIRDDARKYDGAAKEFTERNTAVTEQIEQRVRDCREISKQITQELEKQQPKRTYSGPSMGR